MELWAWLVGYVALFAGLHLLLYYAYLRRDDERVGPQSFAEPDQLHSHPAPESERYARTNEEPGASLDYDDGTRCPHCGAVNISDPAYTYCWRCIATLRQ